MIKFVRPVDLDVPEGPGLTLSPHHTQEESDLDPGTGRLHTSVNTVTTLTPESLVAC